MPVRQQVRPLLGHLDELVLVAIELLDANLPGPFRTRRPAEQDHRAVGRVAGVVLHIGAEGELLPVLAVDADLVDVALHRLAHDSFAVLRPLRGAAGFLRLELCAFLAVNTQDKDADVAEEPAGDGKSLAVGAECRDTASFPGVWS